MTLFDAPTTIALGYDVFVAFLSAIIAYSLFVYVYKVYKLTYRSSYALLATSFLAFAVQLMTAFVGRFVNHIGVIPSATNQTLLLALDLSYIISGIFAMMLLLAVAIKSDIVYAVALSVAATLFVLIQAESHAAYVFIQLFVVSFIALRYVYRAVHKHTASAWWFATGMILLFVSSALYFTPWSLHFQLTVDAILSLLAFSSVFLSIK